MSEEDIPQPFISAGTIYHMSLVHSNESRNLWHSMAVDYTSVPCTLCPYTGVQLGSVLLVIFFCSAFTLIFLVRSYSHNTQLNLFFPPLDTHVSV